MAKRKTPDLLLWTLSHGVVDESLVKWQWSDKRGRFVIPNNIPRTGKCPREETRGNRTKSKYFIFSMYIFKSLHFKIWLMAKKGKIKMNCCTM